MTQQRWSSYFNFIMVTAGAAVGLGPIWKFPYMTGENGGGAFVLVSAVAMFMVGVPILIGEMGLGRLGRANPIATMRNLALTAGASWRWSWLGWWGALALLLVLAFYSVIAGWSLAYIVKLWGGRLSALSATEILAEWDDFLHSPLELIFWHAVFMFLTLFVVARGIHKGLESASRIMMPGLFIVLLILMVYSVVVGDFSRAWQFLFVPDFSKLTPLVSLNALGQAAFALAIGAGCMLMYGAYIPDQNHLVPDSILIATMLLLSSLVSGLAMFPLVFAYNLPVEGGPGLMFTVLPIAFNEMPFGMLFGGLFFIMLWFAAWTSSISMAEPLVVVLIEEYGFTRRYASTIIGSIAWILGIIALLSFNLWEGMHIVAQLTVFDAMASFATNIILPTGALGFAIFSGWIQQRASMQQAINAGNFAFAIWLFLIRFIAPIAIIMVFVAINLA